MAEIGNVTKLECSVTHGIELIRKRIKNISLKLHSMHRSISITFYNRSYIVIDFFFYFFLFILLELSIVMAGCLFNLVFYPDFLVFLRS
jgi:hypothetical protein